MLELSGASTGSGLEDALRVERRAAHARAGEPVEEAAVRGDRDRVGVLDQRAGQRRQAAVRCHRHGADEVEVPLRDIEAGAVRRDGQVAGREVFRGHRVAVLGQRAVGPDRVGEDRRSGGRAPGVGEEEAAVGREAQGGDKVGPGRLGRPQRGQRAVGADGEALDLPGLGGEQVAAVPRHRHVHVPAGTESARGCEGAVRCQREGADPFRAEAFEFAGRPVGEAPVRRHREALHGSGRDRGPGGRDRAGGADGEALGAALEVEPDRAAAAGPEAVAVVAREGAEGDAEGRAGKRRQRPIGADVVGGDRVVVVGRHVEAGGARRRGAERQQGRRWRSRSGRVGGARPGG